MAEASTSFARAPSLEISLLQPAEPDSPPKRKRQGKKAEASCDRCKRRKLKCSRDPPNADSCELCVKAGAECATTGIRKLRIEDERPSTRYKMLEAIVRRTHPGRDTNTLDGLKRLLTEEVSSGNTSKFPEISLPPPTASHENELLHFQPAEGRLIPAPGNLFHYIGPSSSYYFALVVRELVAKCDTVMLPGAAEDGLWRFLKATEFTAYHTSQAIAGPSQSQTDSPNIALGNLDGALDLPLRSLLPDRRTCDALCDIYWTRVHPNMPIFLRGRFQTAYEDLWSGRAETDSSWLCCLALVLVLGAGAQSSHLRLQERLLSRIVQAEYWRLATTPKLENVQALLLLSLHHYATGERNTCWLLLGSAARNAVALGMHRVGQEGAFDVVERSLRRLVWYGLHVFEQALSFALGRPSSTTLVEATAPLPDEVFLDGNCTPSGYFKHAVALTALATKAQRLNAVIAGEWSNANTLEGRIATAKLIFAEFDDWWKSLPARFVNANTADQYQRVMLSLQTVYHHVRSIVGRPFLLCATNLAITAANTNMTPQINPGILEMAQQCKLAAGGALECLAALGRANLLEGSAWMDFYYTHHAILVSCIAMLPYQDGREQISHDIAYLLAQAQSLQLAPTYRILMNIAAQIAFIVGIEAEQPVSSAVGVLFPTTSSDMYGLRPSMPNSPHDFYSDLYNFSFDQPQVDFTNNFDFFNINGMYEASNVTN